MRKSTKYFLLLAFLALVSCSKTPGADSDGVFSLDGVAYPDLQSALDAVPDAEKTYESGTGYKIVKLLGNASGKGGSIKTNTVFELDLGSYTYTLEDGSCISLEDGAGMYLSGSGGCLDGGSGADPAICAGGSFLYIKGDVSIEGSVESSSEVYVEEDFAGTLRGDVSLSDCFMKILSGGKGVEIGNLSVSASEGSEAALCCSQKSGKVNISAINSALPYPVWTDSGDLVGMPDGKKAHVHSYAGTVHHDATCCTEAYDEKSCPVCGHVETEYFYDEADVTAPCPPEDLVHVEAVPDFPPQSGCVEHWQCPHCLKCYSDPEGKTEINRLIGNSPWEIC